MQPSTTQTTAGTGTANAGSDASSTAPSRFKVPDEIGVLAALIGLVAFVGFIHPHFFSVVNLSLLLSSAAFFGIIALATVYLISLGEIDLSVGWIFNFAGVVTANVMLWGISPWLAILVGIGFGALLGAVNGFLAVWLRLPVIIITLGTFSIYQGLSHASNQSRAVVPPDSIEALSNFLNYRIFGSLPLMAIIFVLIAVVLHVVLHHTRFGYRVQAIGSNTDAARLAGLPVARIKVQVLVLLGAMCGLSGALFVGFRGAIDPSSGSDFMLTVIAAVIIGGTPLTGGRGTVIGALSGVLIISVIRTGVIFFGVNATWSTFVTGAVTLFAVALDQLIRTQRAKRLAGGSDSV